LHKLAVVSKRLVESALLLRCLSLIVLGSEDKCLVSAQAVSLCSVLADGAQYDGKEVIVRALYRKVIGGAVLIGSACPKVPVTLQPAPDYKDNKRASSQLQALTKRNQFKFVDVVLRGTFRVTHRGQCSGQNCELYKIEEHELLCAEDAKIEAGMSTYCQTR
jgi:hypothetical protein